MLKGMFFGAAMTLAVFWPTIESGFRYEHREEPPIVAMHIPPIPHVMSSLDNQDSK